MFYEAVLTLEFEHGFCKKKFMIKKKIIEQYYCLFYGYNSEWFLLSVLLSQAEESASRTALQSSRRSRALATEF